MVTLQVVLPGNNNRVYSICAMVPFYVEKNVGTASHELTRRNLLRGEQTRRPNYDFSTAFAYPHEDIWIYLKENQSI